MTSEHASRGAFIPLAWGVALALLLLVHAANFLYFFVDDEAIAFVYAQNVLNGHGLTYNSFEGRVEGYSNFLHVWVSAVQLAVVRMMAWPKVTVFAMGTAVSLVCGALVMFLTFLTLRKLRIAQVAGVFAGGLFLALAGPLAVWSTSALETAPFALLVTALVYRLVCDFEGEPVGRSATAIAIATVLYRIDGFVFVAVVLGAALLVTDAAGRRRIFRTLVLPVFAALVVYHGWRWWYFGSFLPSPVASKVLYKLLPHERLVTKPPATNYVLAFGALYGIAGMIAIAAAVGFAAVASRTGRFVAISAASLIAYLAVVGDWMFGFRFFVPVLPLLAVVLAVSVSRVARWRPAVGWAVALASVAWCAWSAAGFWNSYRYHENHPSWLAKPTLEARPMLSRYGPLVTELAGRVRPGVRTAFNQAGFAAFMLEADNLDTLGICSRWIATLPTTDVFFTEVGRYQPLTNKPVFRAGEAYVLYHEPQFLIEPTALVRSANGHTIPTEMLDGAYRLLFIDAGGENVVYERTARSVAAFQTDPRKFLENVAHVSRISKAWVNGAEVPEADLMGEFPWLRDAGRRFNVAPSHEITLKFSERDIPVHEVFAATIVAARPLHLSITLRSCSGAGRLNRQIDLGAEQPQTIRETLETPVDACQVTLRAEAVDGREGRLEIWDLRVQGRTAALASHVARLPFPKAGQ